MKREELLAEARKHVWAAWQLSAEELASQAVVTLHDVGMLVPEGTAPQLEKLAEQVVSLQAELAGAVRAAAGAVRERDLMRERVSEPFGCAHCGEVKRSHGRRYIGGVGMHGWERPSDEQVKDRMLARRAASMALPSNLSLWEEPAATKALRARVAELEAQVATARTEAIADVGDWLDEHGEKNAAHLVYTCGIPAARDMVTHVVADDSDDPEHVDDCPGCKTQQTGGAE